VAVAQSAAAERIADIPLEEGAEEKPALCAGGSASPEDDGRQIAAGAKYQAASRIALPTR